MKSSLFQKLSQRRERDAEVLTSWEYRGIWETAIKKYSDTAHFIYELLQNADDAGAAWVEFILEKDGLWFKHNGSVKFSISDIDTAQEDTKAGRLGHLNAITAIGNSSKVNDQKIGKFGIGFKAVFAYTLTPHIYDDSFSFRLVNYIVPHKIPAESKRRKPGETLFYFPFDQPAKPKEEAYAEIEEKLKTLFQPVLFLTNLQKIVWASAENNGKYTKRKIRSEKFKDIQASLLQVSGIENGKSKKELLWLFSRKVTHAGYSTIHDISVGFFLLDPKKLVTGAEHKAFCFFSTKEETNLAFITQAPFMLTDSRESIKAGDPWNVAIIQLLANLSADAFLLLRQIGVREKTLLINDSVVDLIPYKETVFSDISSKAKISFKPFYIAILHKFSTESLLPGRKGRYYAKEKAYWASDPELAELFSDQQISDLMGNPKSGWVFVTKGQKQLSQANKDLEAYISSIVTDTLDPKKLLRRITSEFLEAQTDKWLLKFYAYLGGRKSLWDDKDKVALKRPILLNQHRKAVAPFDLEQNTPNIFLPADRATSYDTIYQPFVENEEALAFFKGLGLGKPDLHAEIFKTILPQYNDDFDYNDSGTLLLHFKSLLTYYEEGAASSQQEYLNRLQDIPFIAGRNRENPETMFFCRPWQVYFRNEELTEYFAASPDVCLLDEEFYSGFISNKKKELYAFLTALGVASAPRVQQVSWQVTEEAKRKFALPSYAISQKYFSYQFIYDKELQGLESIVKIITPRLSVMVWDYLLMHMQGKTISGAGEYFMGFFRFVPKGYSYYRDEKFKSTLVSMLQNDRWLFNKKGNLVSARELTRETLSLAYNTQDVYAGVLLELLGIENPDANLNLTPDQKQAMLLGRKLLEEGVTQSDLDELLHMLESRKKASSAQPNPNNKSQEEISVEEEEIDQVLQDIKRSIKRKQQPGHGHKQEESSLPSESAPEPIADQDEYSKPSVNLQKKIDKRKEQMEADIEFLTRIEKLENIVNNAERYSYSWFKSLLDLEYLNSAEANAEGKQISIHFSKVEREPGTERTLILKHPNRYIPQSIEDIGDLQVRLYQEDEYKSVTIEVVSVKEYTLRAKVKKSADISEIDLSKVTRIVIDIKNPVFILEELRKAFYKLNLDDSYNLQQNLTENIRFIFGPSGTGKTTFLSTNEIIPLMRQKKDVKVLVLAPTNKAADVLAKRIIDSMGGDESYCQWLLRFGNAADAELENSPIVVDKRFDIRTKPRNTTITTIARFAYDYFQPEDQEERLHLKYLSWDYIIVDEASMVSLAAIAYVLYQKPEAFFIIAGDPFQIQPITQIEQWKDMNIYSMVQLDKFVNPVTVPHKYQIISLQRQYRAIPTIGNVFSHFTYNGILQHNRKAAEQKPLNIPGLSFKDINIIKFPVSRNESIFKCNTLHRSNYQVYAALFTVEFMHHLAAQISKTHKHKFRIGVICPYKAQATLVEKLLAQLHVENERTEVLVGTIHGFQGDECDIIIAIFNPPFAITQSPNMFLNKQNILNVAISRARDYLFILMPDDSTPYVENLYQIKQIETLIHHHAKTRLSVYKAGTIEKVISGSSTYIYDNSFVTSHQSVNVYSKPEKKYEIRCEEAAIDVQIKHEQPHAATVVIQTPSYTAVASAPLPSETAYEN